MEKLLQTPEQSEYTNEIDTLLTLLVILANHDNTGFGVTLYTNGMIISGIIISMSEYLRLLQAEIRSVTDPNAREHAEGFAQGLQPLVDQIEEELADKKQKSKPSLYRYIHLKDVRVVLPTKLQMNSVWRGKLRDITGFHVGSAT